MTSGARLDLKMDADKKAIVAKAAALCERDFSAFALALNWAFSPNAALKQARIQERRKVRRA